MSYEKDESLAALILSAHDGLEGRVVRAMREQTEEALEAQTQSLLKEIAALIGEKFQATAGDPDAAPVRNVTPGSSAPVDSSLSRLRLTFSTPNDEGADPAERRRRGSQGSTGVDAVATNVNVSQRALRASKRNVIINRSRSATVSEPDEGEWRPCVFLNRVRNTTKSLKEMRSFEVFIAVAIFANATSIGVATDWSLKNPGAENLAHFKILDVVFICIFSVELVIRVLAEGKEFFSPHSKLFGWNVFDSVIVGLCVLNEANPFSFNLGMVRMFRVLRLVSVIRVIRLKKKFRELRMMVSGIMNCGKTLIWAMCILMIVTYIYAVFLLEVMTEWQTDLAFAPLPLGKQDEATKEFLYNNFDSVLWSVYTLGKAVTGGVDWGEISDSLWHVSPLLLVTFPFYVAVTVFCVLNIITAAFCEAAARTAQAEDTNALEHIAAKQKHLKKILELFHRHDTDKGGDIDWEEFQAITNDWRTQAHFYEMGVDLEFHQLRSLFNLFDFDGDGRIDINEFAQGMHHLHGSARSVDMFREFNFLKRRTLKIEDSLARLSKGEFAVDLNGQPKVRASRSASGDLDALSRNDSRDLDAGKSSGDLGAGHVVGKADEQPRDRHRPRGCL